MTFQCNSCGCVLEADVKHVVLPCLHLYCLECAQKQLESDSTCVQCGAMFSHKAVKGVNVLQDASKHALTLCGQTPDVIMQSALTAINCYIKQNELMGALRESKLQRRMEVLHQQCNDKLQQVHTAYTKAKNKSTALAAQLQEANADKEELHNKYQQRSAQVKGLKEQVAALQREQQQLQQQRVQQQQQQQMVGASNQFGNSMAMLGGAGAGMGGAGMGGGRPGRSASPNASPLEGAHMVTTVQRTQLFNFTGDTMTNNAPQMQMPRPGGGGMIQQQQRRNSLAGQHHTGMLLTGNAANLSPEGFDMRPMVGLNGPGSGSRQQQNQHQQQRMLNSGGGGMQMGQMGHGKQGPGSMQGGMLGGGGGGMMHNSNNINLMGSPNPF